MNKTMKRILSVTLAMVLMLGVLATAPLAANADIAVRTDKPYYLKGDRVTAEIYFPKAYSKLACLDLQLEYDKTGLEVETVEMGAGLRKARNEQKNGEVYSENHKLLGRIIWSLAASNNYKFQGVFAKITFNVISTAHIGEHTLKLVVKNAVAADMTDMKGKVNLGNTTYKIHKDPASDLIYELNEKGDAYAVKWYTGETYTQLVIPSEHNGLPVTEILKGAFLQHEELKKITLPETLTAIAPNAFYNCLSLEEIVIPNTVTTIGPEAFVGCKSLKKVALPIGLKKLETKMFLGCKALESIYIPFTVEEIGESAFETCSALKSIQISKNTVKIGRRAFALLSPELQFITVKDNNTLPAYLKTNRIDAKITLIEDLSLGKASTVSDQQFTGKPITPPVTVKLDNGKAVAENKDYYICYVNNVYKGKVSIYVVGTGIYGEGYVVNFNIICRHMDTTEKVLVKDATCTEDGYYEWKCNICGEIFHEVIPAKGHRSDGTWIVDVLPTIFETGLKHRVCTVCGENYDKDTIVPRVYPDVNGDGNINSSDALAILQHSVDIPVELDLTNADTNGDGKVNSVDALTVLQIAVGMIKLPR